MTNQPCDSKFGDVLKALGSYEASIALQQKEIEALQDDVRDLRAQMRTIAAQRVLTIMDSPVRTKQ